MQGAAAQFIHWVNITRTRYCQEPYYLSLNIGLATSPAWGRCIAHSVLQAYFRTADGNDPPEYYLQSQSGNQRSGHIPESYAVSSCVAYYCEANESDLSPHGQPGKQQMCPGTPRHHGMRTRVYQNSNGPKTTVGRGNIAYVSINLPRLALSSSSTNDFFEKLEKTAEKMQSHSAEQNVHSSGKQKT